jgi:hypothetical protein
MKPQSYELTDPVAGFERGDILDVTARFGDWHTYQLKLEPESPRYRSPVVVVTGPSGFSESEILDETARFGNWHEYDLKFKPRESATKRSSSGRVELTADEFERVTEPVEVTA